ncbi:predicted protein [Naegleria gruberi]|uniref:Copper-containing nitrite reductase n=1 Tax=Naegleria gruberi TaxID=5762 RepID=D2VM78_NAEGR|nr:uncharacterized protein NAEGRDRAFT_50708 [Naegleria gruberi]EFC42015.1 predicted protein [Naegleria gruberi]|eukprot:XP_002674759.1 predicted protein [Naegleria gruberi strain NEG-M]
MKLFHRLRTVKPKTFDIVLSLGLTCAVGTGVYQYYKYQCDSLLEAQETPKKHSLFPENMMKKFKKAPELNLELPVVEAILTKAPGIPPPIDRDYPVQLVVNLDTTIEVKPISKQYKYPYWTFNGTVPGPFIRARVGDVMQVNYLNLDETGMAHNIDFHCVTGPGGGAEMLLAEKDEEKTGFFKLLTSGLFIYHCAAGPVPSHISNGMYGLMLVEPEEGLPKVDKEFYVMQSEFYCEPSDDDPKLMEHSYANGLDEKPTYVVFNGREGSLIDTPLLANTGERIRFYFGNAGPNLSSSFHVIGAIFDKVFREGDLVSPPERNVQVTQVPPGGATMIEFEAIVPGTYSFVDHAIFRIEKGAVGFLKIAGAPRPDIYHGMDRPKRCPGCKLHQ